MNGLLFYTSQKLNDTNAFGRGEKLLRIYPRLTIPLTLIESRTPAKTAHCVKPEMCRTTSHEWA
jgi:hypothetical protein